MRAGDTASNQGVPEWMASCQATHTEPFSVFCCRDLGPFPQTVTDLTLPKYQSQFTFWPAILNDKKLHNIYFTVTLPYC